MANVVQPHPQMDLHSISLGHPPQISLGLPLSMSSSLVGWSPPAHASALQHSSSTTNPPPLRALKRRFEQDEEQAELSSGQNPGARDITMERSPTPERPKRAAPKRARNSSPILQEHREGRGLKYSHHLAVENQEVDVGVLLASLPTQSLLPLLNSLVQSQPALKPVILSLIPRPSLDTALQALTQSAKRLRDAYPYSNHPPSQISLTSALGFGFGSSPLSKPTSYAASSLGFGSHVPQQTFGINSYNFSDTTSRMREEYVVSRLRPHVNDFVASFQSYLPYFSQKTSPQPSGTPQPTRRDRSPPTETFLFLQSLTSHILGQPSLTQATLVPLILSRLLDEWKAWVEHVDDVVNRQAGMFGEETVRGWERVLDEFADIKGNGLEALREIRDSWIAKVGWLVGRVGQTMMED
ncbi:hypothetical protein B0F90DRAFT_1678124 [Multifurca ochricompacta]|uniref:Tethering factor for nuclear proteasome STS1 n=1 Tax=Multifurca ochricompacta TaxID=376703 RepID=A0AAD4MDH7_9AGAM|nr:hypothetical protein B0F90DRAFT_1678124 [Multifurca ochricompacta]